MTELPDYLTPELWLGQIFQSREAQSGGIVKRKIRDVERLVGREMFVAELQRRGFRAIENNRHFIIFCNNAPLHRVR